MKIRLLIILLLASFGAVAQNKMYDLSKQFDSVKVKKILATTIATGSPTDSILVKKPNGGIFKIAPLSSPTVANGTWTPASSTVTLTVNFTYYQRVANMVTAFFDVSFPVSASGSAVAITGLPLSPYNYYPLNISVNESGLNIYGETATTGGSILLTDNTHTSITYTQMSGKRLSGSVTYRIP